MLSEQELNAAIDRFILAFEEGSYEEWHEAMHTIAIRASSEQWQEALERIRRAEQDAAMRAPARRPMQEPPADRPGL